MLLESMLTILVVRRKMKKCFSIVYVDVVGWDSGIERTVESRYGNKKTIWLNRLERLMSHLAVNISN